MKLKNREKENQEAQVKVSMTKSRMNMFYMCMMSVWK